MIDPEIHRQITEALFGYNISNLIIEYYTYGLEISVISDDFSGQSLPDRMILIMDRIHDHCRQIYNQNVIICHPMTISEYKNKENLKIP